MRRQHVMSPLLSILTVFLVGYFLLLILVYFYQPNLLYLPDVAGDVVIATPENIGVKYVSVELKTEDEEILDGWYLPAEEERAVLLFCHGNAGNISHRLDSLRIFHALQLSVLIFDYRGYGKSSGTPSEQGTYIDARTAWDYLVDQKKIAPENIILFGRSLGAAVAAELATRVEAGGVILESTFTSVPDLASQLYPFLPVRLFGKFSYNTLSRLSHIHTPLLIVHSEGDEIISFSHAEQLYDGANKPKQLLVIMGGHNEGFMVSKNYQSGLNHFISTIYPDQ